MIAFEEKQKQGWLEAFISVATLYQVLNDRRGSLRAEKAKYHCDEVQALPLDFVLDVEIKAKRTIGHTYYAMFTRLVLLQQLELLPESVRLALGQVWLEYGLVPDGAYRKLYFNVKNAQVRSYMKGTTSGIFRASGDGWDGATSDDSLAGSSDFGPAEA
jgi:hypothetical protein